MKRLITGITLGCFIFLCPSLSFGLSIFYHTSWYNVNSPSGTEDQSDYNTTPVVDPKEDTKVCEPPVTDLVEPVIVTPEIIDSIDPQPEGTPAPVPEPATMLLLGAGLIGMAGLRKKIDKN